MSEPVITSTSPPPAEPPAPDASVALLEEREHLARSLADLDAEHAAGDLAEEDYTTLRDDYVARTAAVLRAIQAGQRPATTRRRRGPRAMAVATLVVAFGVGAGFLVARLAGTRTSGDTITGDIRATTRQDLASCLELASGALRGAATDGGTGADSAQLFEAVKCYSELLQRVPGNPEALTYRGWLLVRTGSPQLQAQAAGDLDAAVAADPTYPDARAFRTIVFLRLGQLDAARSELQILDTLNTPPIINSLLEQFGVRQALAE
ncbi:MAG: hypothetical protein ACKV2O_10925 [Acidimicrobiales bacterium]